MMDHSLFQILEMAVLAVVQGIGEFLPISSSGHILVIGDLFALTGNGFRDEGLLVSIMLHLGTLFSVFVVFWRRIVALLAEDRRVIPLLILGTVPVVAVGLPLKKFFPELLNSSLLTGCCFIGTAVLLLYSNHSQKTEIGERLYRQFTIYDVLWVGLFQAIAIFPGFSRSGFTIVGGLLRKLRRDEAATFSFLLSIPAIGGAGLYESLELIRNLDSPEAEPIEGFGLILMGAFLSFFIGVIALKWLLTWLQKGKLHYFAYWLLLLGPMMIVLSLCVPADRKNVDADESPSLQILHDKNNPEKTKIPQIPNGAADETEPEHKFESESESKAEEKSPDAANSEKPEYVQAILEHLNEDSFGESESRETESSDDNGKGESEDDATKIEPSSVEERPDSFWKSESPALPLNSDDSRDTEDSFPAYVEPPKLTIRDLVGFTEDELVQMDVEDPIWITKDKKQLVILGRICLREGVLELFACAKGSKEHESVVSIDAKPLFIHAGLLAVGAEPGRPARFDPEFFPPEGDEIEIRLRWKQEDETIREVLAQELVAEIEYTEDGRVWDSEESNRKLKEMTTPFVFTGSFFREFENENGEKNNFYMADVTGELFSVSNFPSSILDVPIKSTDSNESLLFRPFTQRVPELHTPVTLILTPKKNGDSGSEP